ncbi:Leucine-rich repeat domain superfamily [Sesbania bispinosa]|nr:Leucine-rich repeat domain superfamily [Sesbania bispinosa]
MRFGSTATTGSSTREERLPKMQKANEDDDIINKLPEFVIGCILSFSQQKDAVRTSVLSKIWIQRWTSITKLDFDDTVFYSPKRKTGGKQFFINFVNRALLLTKGSSLESFSLVMANKYDVLLVNTWISSILNRNVKNLHIDSHFELSFSAFTSHSLFESFYSLEELVLKMCSCALTIPPTYVYFGHLKLLKLSGIVLTIDSSPSYALPRLSLPVLRKFETVNCIWSSAKDVTLEAPLLESVLIEEDCNSVSHVPRSCTIYFSALHLKEFTYRGFCISQPITLSDPSSAHNASAKIILYQCENRVPATGSRAFLLLTQFSQVKYLKFDGSEVLAQQKVSVLPVFGMLSHLELGFVSGEVLLGILLKSPILKTVLFKGISKFDIELLNSAVVPDCLASTLQVVKFGKVHGYEHELYLAKFMMENGLVLERMSFSLASHGLGKSKVMEEFKEKLFSFKKGFSLLLLNFHI